MKMIKTEKGLILVNLTYGEEIIGKIGINILLIKWGEKWLMNWRKRLLESLILNEHNRRVHIKNSKGDYKIRIDPPDRITDYNHMHIYDKNEKPLDINGNIVNRKSPDAHIPWDKY